MHQFLLQDLVSYLRTSREILCRSHFGQIQIHLACLNNLNSTPGSIQVQVGFGLEYPGPVEIVSAQGRGVTPR